MARLRVAVDIGGTFTDTCILNDADGTMTIAKVSSTSDPIDGVVDSLRKGDVDLRDVTLFSHGTTVATNALVTRRLPRTAMVLTRGFRDVIEIRRGTKEDLWDMYEETAPPYISRRDRLVVAERIDYTGQVIEPLNEEEAREVARILRKRGVAAVAVCFMNSFLNPVHERRMREILEEDLSDVDISISSEVLPEIFEHERFSTTAVNAILGPVVGQYAIRLSEQLERRGYDSDLLLLHSGGGVMTARTSKEFAARLAGSGIAAGAIASRHIAGICGYDNAIGLDMGGTSCDVSLTYAGAARITKDWAIQYGYPICFPSIEVKTIGAGGGSLAWIDEAGSLRNGPQSAGSDPGPACYGRNQPEPTNTDANLILGRLGTRLIGGDLGLDPKAAERSVRTRIAGPLELDVSVAAKAILSVANANMADAVRVISIARGYDPRDFVLVAFGGAGPLHGAALAKDLTIPTVVVPPWPGVSSAMGCLLVDIRHDLGMTYLVEVGSADPAHIEEGFTQLEREARRRLEKEGVSPEDTVLQRSVDLRYLGQWRSLAVPVPAPLRSVDEAVADFQESYEREYNYRRDDAPVEIYQLNLSAIGVTPKAELARYPVNGGAAEPRTRRSVLFDEGDEPFDTPVYRRENLPAGAEFHGPAIIEQVDSTTVVPPGARAEVDPWLNIRIHVSEIGS